MSVTGSVRNCSWTTAETAMIREMLLEQVGRYPRMPATLFAALLADYGSCGHRRLWRALAWLTAGGHIERSAAGYRRPRSAA